MAKKEPRKAHPIRFLEDKIGQEEGPTKIVTTIVNLNTREGLRYIPTTTKKDGNIYLRSVLMK